LNILVVSLLGRRIVGQSSLFHPFTRTAVVTVCSSHGWE
jgi:hypothetical protein